MPFARLLVLLGLVLAAPDAHAQRGIVARSYAEVDTSKNALVRALVLTADSVGLRVALDSATAGVLRGTRGGVRVRVYVARTRDGRAGAMATSDYGRALPEESERLNLQLKWLQAAARHLFRDTAGRRLTLFSLVALDPAVPACTTPNDRYRYRADDRAPAPKSQVPPGYPEDARINGYEAAVVVAATVDERGRVTCSGAVSAMPFGFTDAAVLAVSKWRFEPPIIGGQPAAVTVFIPIVFRRAR